MKSIEESVVITMDGSDKELFPFLPYILQDLWEIGADPDIIIRLIRKHAKNIYNLKRFYCKKVLLINKESRKAGIIFS